jgi:hypothetical protein
MAKVNLVNKKIQLSRSEIIKFQLISHCYFEKSNMSESDYNCLTLLGGVGKYDLSEFCELAASYHIFKSTQTVRNCLIRMEKMGLISKEGKSRKQISLHPDLKIQTKGNILLNYNIIHIES